MCQPAKLIVIMCVLIFGFSAFPLDALAIKEVLFPEKYSLSGDDLTLRGVALKKFWFLSVYKAGFYLSQHVDSRDALNDVPKRIEVVYLKNIPEQKNG